MDKPCIVAEPSIPSFENTLTSQELTVIMQQSNLQVLRYNIATHKTTLINSFHLLDAYVENDTLPEDFLDNGYLSKDCEEIFSQLFLQISQGIPQGEAEYKIKQNPNEYQWHHLRYALVYDENKFPLYAILTISDNTKQREMQTVYEKWKSNLAALTAHSIYYIELNLKKGTIDHQEGNTFYFRDEKSSILFDEFIAYGKHNIVHKDDIANYPEFFDRKRLLNLYACGVIEDSMDYRVKKENDGYMWLRCDIHMVKYPFSDDILAIIAYSDIDKNKRELENLAQKASHDSLTGIYNRGMLEKEINDYLSNISKTELCAFLIIDIDDFKQVNDTYGHKKGDEVLQKIGTILTTFSNDAIIGRLGGDEFIVFLENMKSHRAITQVANQMLKKMNFYIEDKKSAQVSSSIGIAVREDETTFSSLYTKADNALYSAKDNGKNQYHYYNYANSQTSLEIYTNHQKYDSKQIEKILEYIDGAIILCEIRGPYWKDIDVIYTSPSYYRILGYSENAINEHYKQVLNYVSKDDMPGMVNAVWKAARTDEKVEYIYHVELPGNHEVLRRVIHLQHMPTNDKQTYFVTGIISDITNLTEQERDS